MLQKKITLQMISAGIQLGTVRHYIASLLLAKLKLRFFVCHSLLTEE